MSRAKGNANREIQRNPLPLALARSPKGNENQGNHRKMLPFPARRVSKGNANRETQQNPLPLVLARSPKGNENQRKRETLKKKGS